MSAPISPRSRDPDGYTIFIVGPGQATNKFLYPSLTYDPVNDFQPVSLLLTQPNMMCVPNSSPAKSVKEFIDYCKANPDKATYASSGNGTTLHLSGELFKKLAGVQMQHIPYRGSGPLMNDLIPGRVDVVFDNAPSISPHVKGGAVRGLAVTTLKRVAIAPELPTIDESGVKGFDVLELVRVLLPGEGVEGDRDQTARRHRRRAEARHGAHPPARTRRRPGRLDAGRTRKTPASPKWPSGAR